MLPKIPTRDEVVAQFATALNVSPAQIVDAKEFYVPNVIVSLAGLSIPQIAGACLSPADVKKPEETVIVLNLNDGSDGDVLKSFYETQVKQQGTQDPLIKAVTSPNKGFYSITFDTVLLCRDVIPYITKLNTQYFIARAQGVLGVDAKLTGAGIDLETLVCKVANINTPQQGADFLVDANDKRLRFRLRLDLVQAQALCAFYQMRFPHMIMTAPMPSIGKAGFHTVFMNTTKFLIALPSLKQLQMGGIAQQPPSPAVMVVAPAVIDAAADVKVDLKKVDAKAADPQDVPGMFKNPSAAVTWSTAAFTETLRVNLKLKGDVEKTVGNYLVEMAGIVADQSTARLVVTADGKTCVVHLNLTDAQVVDLKKFYTNMRAGLILGEPIKNNDGGFIIRFDREIFNNRVVRMMHDYQKFLLTQGTSPDVAKSNPASAAAASLQPPLPPDKNDTSCAIC